MSPQKGGDPKKVTRGDKGRDPIFSRGDVTSKLLLTTKFTILISILGLFLRLMKKKAFLNAYFRNFFAYCLTNTNMKKSSK